MTGAMRIYAAVYRWRLSGLVLAGAVMICLIWGSAMLRGLPSDREAKVALFAATLAGLAVAMALVNDAPLVKPQTLRVAGARGLWLAVWLASGIGLLCGTSIGSGVSAGAVARDVGIGFGLAVPAALVQQVDLMWCGPLIGFGATAFLSSADVNGESAQWWAVLLNSTWHPGDWWSVLIPVVAAVLFILRGTERRL